MGKIVDITQAEILDKFGINSMLFLFVTVSTEMNICYFDLSKNLGYFLSSLFFANAYS